MPLFLENVTWVSPGSEADGKRISIRMSGNRVAEAGPGLKPAPGDTLLQATGTCLSPGWVDTVARTGEPGNPENETLDSFFRAAAAGGFTQVQILPDTRHPIQSVESVAYYRGLSHPTGVTLQVSAAATADLGGKKMAEALRLGAAGARSLASVHPITDTGFFTRLLQYMSHSALPLFHFCWDPSLTAGGQIHEGVVSDRTGLAGIPGLAEEVMVNRDISVCRYTGGRLHLPLLSDRRSVEAVGKARTERLPLSAGVASHQLLFTHEAPAGYDTVHKVMPPYREEEDREALRNGIREGIIEVVSSCHTPLHADYKDGEFDLAAFGISSLETCYAALATAMPDLSPGRQSELLSLAPRRLLGLEIPAPEPGQICEFTWFDPSRTWTPAAASWQSRSRNNPFFGVPLRGAVLGIFTGTGFWPNPSLSPIS